MIRVVVFDFDDTLVVSDIVKREMFWKIFQPLGRTAVGIAKKYVLENQETPRQAMIKGIITALSSLKFFNEESLSEECFRWLEEYNLRTASVVIKAPEVRGAVAAIESLGRYYQIYVNSATPQAELEKIITGRGWQDLFDGIFGSPPGTKLENLRKIMEVEEATPDEVVVVGDGKSDLDCARACSCHFILINGIFSPILDNSDTGLEDLTSVPDIVALMSCV